MRSVARIGETAVIAAKTGIKYATAAEKPNNAKMMRETFESLGSTYIKLGQFIASTPSLFPREFVEEFQGCLDQTPTLPFLIFNRFWLQNLQIVTCLKFLLQLMRHHWHLRL